MSGATLPYRLRPHKAVDRRLFIDLLARCERWQTLENHAYVSMASYTMEDQKLVHRLIGIRHLFAFDMDENVVNRQLFNRPIGDAKCVALDAQELTADIAKALNDANITEHEGYVIWLDYTDPKSIGEQLREFSQLLPQLAPGDVVRVTVNADYNALAGRKHPDQPQTRERRQEKALIKLRERIGDYLPDDVNSSDLDEHGLAVLLSRAFGRVADGSIPALGNRTMLPLSIVRYADGLQMLSMTATVCLTDDIPAIRRKLGLETWPFSSADWTDVKFLAVPDLTVRERLYLEQHIFDENDKLLEGLGFDLDEVTQMPGFVENFRSYYRHYPALSPVEL